MSFAATGIMALALILFLGLLSLQFMTSQVVSSLQDKIDISAYFKSRHAQDELIQESLNQLNSNPLAASLKIKTRDSSQYASVAQFLENNNLRSIIDKINFYENKGVIERIESISGGIKGWGLIITLLLALIAILVIFNTVRLTIFNQKQEIEIMRLVGASNWHIRGPYLAEGGLYGLFASLIALLVFYPSIYFVSDKIASFAPTVNIFDYFFVGLPQVILMVVGLGVALGVASSSIAIRKHLKI